MKIDDDVGELDISDEEVKELRDGCGRISRPKFMIKSPSHDRITSGPSIVVRDRDAGRF